MDDVQIVYGLDAQEHFAPVVADEGYIHAGVLVPVSEGEDLCEVGFAAFH